MMQLEEIIDNQQIRHLQFPVTEKCIYLAHAGVSPLPQIATDAIQDFLMYASHDTQENDWGMREIARARTAAAKLLGCSEDEIALLGPTSLGLNLVANGLPLKPNDEVIYYEDDYPANVYPWKNLKVKGIKPVPLKPPSPGSITWTLIEKAITKNTKLVALASCNFLSGYQIDIDTIGKNLHEHDILFCVDGIQSLGAFPLSVEYVDFLSADSHKWMMGPVGAGIFYVKKSRQELLQPTLLGSWNVSSPNFIAQDTICFEAGARRYEPGTLNVPGIVGMLASLEMLLDIGICQIGHQIRELRKHLLQHVYPLGFQLYAGTPEEERSEQASSGIISLFHPDLDMQQVFTQLDKEKIRVSLRQNRAGQKLLRIAPHFYNTRQELDKLIALLH